ncbi:sensor histidine kinase [Priestia endophytica]|uniref:sensor histidine kinase n=1 Tax=Priestia endophytica TaxID=135735 RepID=UPI000DCA4C24|nr:HAMP domain-containing sensor histidine kinase [Priestia endophytica]RAS71645.1 ATP-binding protein [Priestia endophytica]
MLILVILLWLMGALLFIKNPKNEKIRWASYIGFFGGFGGVGVLLGKGTERPELALVLDGIFTSIGHYWTPYAILIFGLMYSDTVSNPKHKNLYKWLLLIPPIIMYFTFPIYPEFRVNFDVLSIWIVPYVLISNFLLVYSAWKETRLNIKRQKALTALLIVPMTTFAVTTNIILEAFGFVGIWKYNTLVITIQFFVFLYFSIRYGILGVQIRVEKERRDTTMKAVVSGTALLNHTIKNEIAKIDFLVSQLRDYIPENEKVAENIDLTLNSTQHVLELSTRIQSKLNIMDLKESSFWLSSIVERTLDLLKPYITSEITIIKQYETNVELAGDVIHVQEAFMNIIKNAIEAMDKRGSLIIKVYQSRNKVYIDFKDNGKGIEQDQVPLVLDPFYSTKRKVGNYGLGLTYCYNVIQKHDGDISIKSRVNQGTTITLMFPSKRIRSINKHHNSQLMGEKVHVSN